MTWLNPLKLLNCYAKLLSCSTPIKDTNKVVTCDDCRCFCAANPAERAEVVGHTGSAAVGVQPAHEHGGSLCPPAGGVGGGEDGPLPPHLGTGITLFFTSSRFQISVVSAKYETSLCSLAGFELSHTYPGPNSLRAESQRDCDRCARAVCSVFGYVKVMTSQICVTLIGRSLEWVCFAFTDNVTLQIDGVLYLRILDPFKVSCPDLSSACCFPLIKVTRMVLLPPVPRPVTAWRIQSTPSHSWHRPPCALSWENSHWTKCSG